MKGSLQIRTFGGLTIQRDGQIVSGFASRKAELLLVYLACNPHPHHREFLAELLWDDRPQRRALSNLRVVLSSLRKSLGPFVVISRDTAGIEPGAAIWLDASELERALPAQLTEETAASTAACLDLYRGDFLEGVHVRGARGLEEWIGRERERLHQLAVAGQQALLEQALQAGRYRRAIGRGRRLLELDPLLESAHRQLMLAYALSGDRGNALAQYESCCQLLRDELLIEPVAETVALYEAIRDDGLPRITRPAPSATATAPAVRLPSFLTGSPAREAEAAVFVARERELAWLHEQLDKAVAGDGRLVFVAGEAGMGKTALLQAFGRHAAEDVPQLLVASGRGSALGRAGDPQPAVPAAARSVERRRRSAPGRGPAHGRPGQASLASVAQGYRGARPAWS